MFWAQLNLLRRWTSPLLYWIFRYTKYRGRELPDIWDSIKDLSIDDFHLEILLNAEFDYLSDPLGGLLDYSPQEKNFFFLDRKTSRDCDNWSRMWYWYHTYHYRKTKEIAMKNLDTGRAHAVTVTYFLGEGWELYDYRPTQLKEETIEKALHNNVVGYTNFIWTELKG